MKTYTIARSVLVSVYSDQNSVSKRTGRQTIFDEQDVILPDYTAKINKLVYPFLPEHTRFKLPGGMLVVPIPLFVGKQVEYQAAQYMDVPTSQIEVTE